MSGHRRFSGLAEYPGDPRAIASRIVGPAERRGPLQSPILEKPADPTSRDLYDLISNLPMLFFRKFESMGIVQPHDIQSFVKPSGQVALAVTTDATVASFTLPEQSDGFLTFVGVQASGGSINNVSWSITVNGAPHPQFSKLIFEANNLSTPFEFKVQLNRGQTVAIIANSTIVTTVSAILVGWSRLIPDV